MPRFLKALILLIFAPLLAAAAFGQAVPAPDPLLGHMVGAWVVTGSIEGQPTTHDVTAEWVLGKNYVRLNEVSREKNPDGSPAYEAIIFIDRQPKNGPYVCIWLDDTGPWAANSAGLAKAKGNTLPFVFSFGGSRFFNTMTYRPDSDSWQWNMDGVEKGVKKPFARVTLTRRK
jgi:hypothetical protein